MPQYLHPGVYIEEQQGNAPIQAAPTAIPAFLIITEKGPFAATLVTSFEEYQQLFGGYDSRSEGT